MFRALIVDRDDDNFNVEIRDLTEDELPEGDVLIDVEYSTINYKDALAVTDSSPIVRSWPMVPGIDLAGQVAESTLGEVPVGSRVVVNGWGLGEKWWGGYTQRARLRGEWTVPIPEPFDTNQAMAIGTAGYTAMLCVLALEDHNVGPTTGPVLVTGAAGGVGGVAVSLLAGLGYEVHASTGRLDETQYLRALGATEVIDRAELAEPSTRPLVTPRWAGAVDVVGSYTLANLLASISPEGCVAACGLAQGMDLPASVAPFILRGVTLRGIDSVTVPRTRRLLAWARLAAELDVERLYSMVNTIGLGEVQSVCKELLKGGVRGRVVVDVNR